MDFSVPFPQDSHSRTDREATRIPNVLLSISGLNGPTTIHHSTAMFHLHGSPTQWLYHIYQCMQVCPKMVRRKQKFHPLVHHNVSWCHGLWEIFQFHPKQKEMQNPTYNSDNHTFLFFGLLWLNVFRLEGDVKFKVPHDSSAPACIPVSATSTVASSGRFLRFARYFSLRGGVYKYIYICVCVCVPSGKLT